LGNVTRSNGMLIETAPGLVACAFAAEAASARADAMRSIVMMI
jgi:hypothetical protein